MICTENQFNLRLISFLTKVLLFYFVMFYLVHNVIALIM